MNDAGWAVVLPVAIEAGAHIPNGLTRLTVDDLTRAKVKELGVSEVAIFVAPDRVTGKLLLSFDAELVPEKDSSDLPGLLTEVGRRLVDSGSIPPITPVPPFEAMWHRGDE